MRRISQRIAFAVLSLLLIVCYNYNSYAEVRCFPNPKNTVYRGIAVDGQILLPAEYRIEDTPLSYLIYEDASSKVGYYDKTSGFLQMPLYEAVLDYYCTDSSAPILVKKNNLWGYLNRNDGTIAIAIQYTGYSVYSEFYNGYALPTNHFENSTEIYDQCYLIDKNGREIVFSADVEPFGHVQDNGLLIVSTMYNTGLSLFGIGNTAGQVLVYPEYDRICEFSNGYASVRKNGKWGHINEQGFVILPPTYELLEEENEGYYFDDNGLATFQLSDGSWITIGPE